MRRFFTDQPLQPHTDITLCTSSHHHWIRVLRAKMGDQAILFNGTGGEYTAQLTQIDKKTATARLTDFHPINRDNPYRATLALVMSKGDRMDYAIQKATELGVHDIQLLTSEYCQVKLTDSRLLKKRHHWQSIAISACEQCGLNLVPQVHAPLSIAAFSSQASHDLKLVMAPTADGTANLPLPDTLPLHICLLIGAEGGLTTQEIHHLVKQEFIPWCFGQRIVRTETAPVIALSTLLNHQLR